MTRSSITTLYKRAGHYPQRQAHNMITTRLVLDSIGETAGRITMAGLTVIIAAIFLVMAIGSKMQRGR